jgi:DNA-binding CsgD family transcriptional regulator
VFRLRGVEFVVFEITAHVAAPAVLTTSEADVVRLLSKGRSTAEIATTRSVSYRTVANQLAAVYRKLGVSSRTELLALLARR